MPAPSLKRYTGSASTTAVETFTIIVPAVPAGRALVVSKVTCSNAQSNTPGANATAFDLRIIGGTASECLVTYRQVLSVGELFTETGLVLLPGDRLEARSPVTNGIAVTVFGQEVDN